MRYTLELKIETEGVDPSQSQILAALEAAVASLRADPAAVADLMPSLRPDWLRQDRNGKAVFVHPMAEGDEAIVPCLLRSDDGAVEVIVDGRFWLGTAEPEEIEALANEEWEFGEAADQVYYFYEAAGEPGATALSDYLSRQDAGRQASNDAIGFGVSVDPSAAMAWLGRHRPDVLAGSDRMYAERNADDGVPL